MDEERVEKAVDRTEKAADRTERTAGWTQVVLKVLLVISVALLVTTGGLAYLVQKNNENNEDTRQVLGSVRDEVHTLVEFTERLEQETPQEQQNDEAIQFAVQLVPVIVEILCGDPQFAGDPSCQGG